MAEAPAPALHSACDECAALCCVLLFFDKGPHFPLDKPAGTPCAHLAPTHSCTIHQHRAAAGYGGCIRFECHGAGQRTTRLFAGQSWADSTATAKRMSGAFSAMLRLHEALAMLDAAAKLPLSADQQARRRALAATLALPEHPDHALAALGDMPLAAVHTWLESLRATLPDAAREALAGSPQQP